MTKIASIKDWKNYNKINENLDSDSLPFVLSNFRSDIEVASNDKHDIVSAYEDVIASYKEQYPQFAKELDAEWNKMNIEAEKEMDNLKPKNTNENNESGDNKFTYMMLSRLQTDNDYFLGNGARSPMVLWAHDVDAQIAEMKRLWNSLPEDAKPEWLSMEDILSYEEKMKETTNESLDTNVELFSMIMHNWNYYLVPTTSLSNRPKSQDYTSHGRTDDNMRALSDASDRWFNTIIHYYMSPELLQKWECKSGWGCKAKPDNIKKDTDFKVVKMDTHQHMKIAKGAPTVMLKDESVAVPMDYVETTTESKKQKRLELILQKFNENNSIDKFERFKDKPYYSYLPLASKIIDAVSKVKPTHLTDEMIKACKEHNDKFEEYDERGEHDKWIKEMPYQDEVNKDVMDYFTYLKQNIEELKNINEEQLSNLAYSLYAEYWAGGGFPYTEELVATASRLLKLLGTSTTNENNSNDLEKTFLDKKGKNPKVNDFIKDENNNIGKIKSFFKDGTNEPRMVVDFNSHTLELNPKSKFEIINPDENIKKVFDNLTNENTPGVSAKFTDEELSQIAKALGVESVKINDSGLPEFGGGEFTLIKHSDGFIEMLRYDDVTSEFKEFKSYENLQVLLEDLKDNKFQNESVSTMEPKSLFAFKSIEDMYDDQKEYIMNELPVTLKAMQVIPDTINNLEIFTEEDALLQGKQNEFFKFKSMLPVLYPQVSSEDGNIVYDFNGTNVWIEDKGANYTIFINKKDLEKFNYDLNYLVNSN